MSTNHRFRHVERCSPFLVSQPTWSAPCQNSIPSAEAGTGTAVGGPVPASLLVADLPDCVAPGGIGDKRAVRSAGGGAEKGKRAVAAPHHVSGVDALQLTELEARAREDVLRRRNKAKKQYELPKDTHRRNCLACARGCASAPGWSGSCARLMTGGWTARQSRPRS